MKSILLSTHPKHIISKINGLKKIEIRKTKPKELPFKVYEYCTKARNTLYRTQNGSHAMTGYEVKGEIRAFYGDKEVTLPQLNGKVVLEYVVNKVENFSEWQHDYPSLLRHIDLYAGTKGDYALLDNYLKGKKHGYAWHISDLKIYDTPLELKDFYKPLSDKDLDEGNYDLDCFGEVLCMDQPEGSEYCQDCEYGGAKPITHPPQSWQYVRGRYEWTNRTV